MPREKLLPLLLEIGLVPAGRALVDCRPGFKDAQGCIGDAPHSAQGPFLFPVRLWGWRKEITFLRCHPTEWQAFLYPLGT